ncbi:unnamed protein product [Cladocopium goreaui]|uniref:fructose-bisphosphate aldolase n=1 Tax=Cladocopium goreaui TaxID=2562237 RepID=A0A9P1D445_9DINO|nr:unnamed protein product [Cladocopium goreaui]
MEAFIAARAPIPVSFAPVAVANAAHESHGRGSTGSAATASVALLCAIGSSRGRRNATERRIALARRRPPAKVARQVCHRSCHGGEHLSPERKQELEAICQKIATPGKGITATDEGPGTIGGRFENVGVENTEEHRRIYRQMLYDTPGINNYLSAAILDPETMYQKDDDGVPFPQALEKRNIIPGVKPHLKVYELPGCPGDTVMQGLDSLAQRCKEYKAAGAKFAKWRSPLQISRWGPSRLAIEANMNDLARYALICQDEGLVPIVEPDIVMKGEHDLETAMAVNIEVQSTLYKAMLEHGVYMEGTILKTNLVNPGLSCDTDYSVEEIAMANTAVLRRTMPVAIRGVNFLSGGQTLEGAAARLNAINQVKNRMGRMPWNISFSWSWALQAPLLDLCKGKGGKIPLKEMSELYLQELAIASAAAQGKYKEGIPPEVIREDEEVKKKDADEPTKEAEAKKEEPRKDEKKEEPKKEAEAKKEEPKKEEKKEEPRRRSEAKKEEPKKEEKKEEPKKEAEAKKEEPKKEEKKEEPNKEAEAKKEEPKKEEKKEEPKKEAEAKQEEPKKEEKKEEPKKEAEAKKEEPKKEEKKEEPKKEAEAKQEEPKKEEKKEEPKKEAEAKKEEPKKEEKKEEPKKEAEAKKEEPKKERRRKNPRRRQRPRRKSQRRRRRRKNRRRQRPRRKSQRRRRRRKNPRRRQRPRRKSQRRRRRRKNPRRR